ncbi:50S ribosomal protein L30 [uncultured archaeon]|nr:50S ribosomal protein L30 [uncultured archaeon]
MLAVIRIRGRTGLKPAAKKTAELLRLNRINHMVILEDNDVTRGMLNRARDYLTWGEIDEATLEAVLEHRAMLAGRKKLEEEQLKEITGSKDFSELAKSLIKGKIKYRDIEGIVPLFRLNPPKRGYEAVRKSFQNGGSSGYRGEKINELIKRMVLPGVDLNGSN